MFDGHSMTFQVIFYPLYLNIRPFMFYYLFHFWEFCTHKEYFPRSNVYVKFFCEAIFSLELQTLKPTKYIDAKIEDSLDISTYSGGSRIFPRGGAPTPKIAIIFHIFAENCMKMKEFGPSGGASLAPPLGSANDLPSFIPPTAPSQPPPHTHTPTCPTPPAHSTHY